MESILAIDQLYQHLDNMGTDEAFEDFDELYEQVTNNEVTFRLSDIEKLCLIFRENIKYMEPHQFVKIRKMTYITINRYGVNDGFKELVKGINQIIDFNLTETRGYLNMLMNGYNDNEIKVFADILTNYSKPFIEKICKLIVDMKNQQPQYYEKKGSIILNIVCK